MTLRLAEWSYVIIVLGVCAFVTSVVCAFLHDAHQDAQPASGQSCRALGEGLP